jgi:hypothetical protein
MNISQLNLKPDEIDVLIGFQAGVFMNLRKQWTRDELNYCNESILQVTIW